MTAVHIDPGYLEADAAYIADYGWNGFTVPYFTRTEADRLAAELVAEAARYMLEYGDDEGTEVPIWDEDAQVYYHIEPEDGSRWDYATMLHPETGETLHGIGAAAWTWTVAE